LRHWRKPHGRRGRAWRNYSPAQKSPFAGTHPMPNGEVELLLDEIDFAPDMIIRTETSGYCSV
jgi:hypothetical protein